MSTARHCKRHPSSMDVCMYAPSVDIINHTKTPYVRSVCLRVLEKSAVVTIEYFRESCGLVTSYQHIVRYSYNLY